MIKAIFIGAAVLYWISFSLRFFLWTRQNRKLEMTSAVLEKAGLLVFTSALVLYIGKLQIVNGEVHSLHYDRPVSFLLFAWAVSAAHIVTEVVYGNRLTAVFANFWTALSLTISSSTAYFFRSVFNSDLEWLSFHRLCFLLGYAFCILAFPLVVRYLRLALQKRTLGAADSAALEPELRKVDRMGYRMVLCALPLLTAGIITEGLLLLEAHRLPSPEQLWTDRQESLLALATWFLCGVYLHTRLFFGWKNLKSATLYLSGLMLLLSAHFSHALLRLF